MKKILVSIVMGSDSDLVVMADAARVLEDFDIFYEITILSAHRTPEKLVEYGKSLVLNGIKVVIAGAGGSAALAGMIAALTPLPVIGVPIYTKTLQGLDSLFSTVQMPSGIPVATVAINGAKNAGLLAARIIGIGDKKLTKAITLYASGLEASILSKAKKLERTGYSSYLKGMTK